MIPAFIQVDLLRVNKYSSLKPNNHACSFQPTMSTVGERIKEARERKQLTQADVANEAKRRFPKVRLTQQNLAALEKGKQHTSGALAEIAAVLDVHAEWLALGSGPRDREGPSVTVTDPKLIAALKIMQPMKEYQRDQAIKILDTLAEPSVGGNHNGTKANNG